MAVGYRTTCVGGCAVFTGLDGGGLLLPPRGLPGRGVRRPGAALLHELDAGTESHCEGQRQLLASAGNGVALDAHAGLEVAAPGA
jgi:hypothetical protein